MVHLVSSQFLLAGTHLGVKDGKQHGVVGGTRCLKSGKSGSYLSSAMNCDLTSIINCNGGNDTYPCGCRETE